MNVVEVKEDLELLKEELEDLESRMRDVSPDDEVQVHQIQKSLDMFEQKLDKFELSASRNIKIPERMADDIEELRSEVTLLRH